MRPAESVDFGEPGIPTGNIDIQPTASVSPARLIAQTATVLAAALLVGIVVFLVVRAAVGSGDGADDEETGIDDSAIIDPGPAEDEALGVDNSTRSGSRRSTSEDGQVAVDGNDADPLASLTDEDSTDEELATSAPTDTSVPTASSTTSVPGDEDNDLQATTSVPLGSTSITTGGPFASAPPTTGSATSTSSPAPTPVPTTSSPTTDAPATSIGATTTDAPTITTTLPTATTATTTATTAPPTSQPQPPVGDLIALPGDGDTRRWDTFTRFRAEEITEATRYCWTFTSAGGTREDCTGEQLFDLPAAPDDVYPGSVTVKAQAFAADGTLLGEDRITINFQDADFAERPSTGDRVDLSDGLRFESREVLGADRYCWTVEQPRNVTTGEMCDADRRLTVDADDPRLADIDTAPARIGFAAYRGNVQIAAQGIRVELR